MNDDPARAPAIDLDPLPDGLASPARRALASAGVTALRHLTAFTEAEVRLMHGMGPKALAVLRAALDRRGWSFADG
ncbi:MAG: DNA-binding protein [Ilumatobacteraceae bacterium]|jgi:hypothetical protein